MQFKHLWQAELFFFHSLAGLYLDEQRTTAKSAIREDV
jgi:hypothetical protein